MRYRVVILLLLLLLLPGNGARAAWELRTDFRAAVDASVLDRSVAEAYRPMVGEEVFQVPDFQVQSGGIPVTVSGIFGRIQYSIQSPMRTGSSLAWDANSDQVRVELAVQRVNAVTFIRKEFNGGTINIRVEGNCDGVRLSIPAQAGAKIFARVRAMVNEGNLRLATETATMDWPENAWQVDRLECSGVEGFGTAVRAEALKVLSRPQKEMQAGLYTAIQKRLDSWAASALNVAIAPRLIFDERPDILMQSTPTTVAEQPGGSLLMDGVFRVLMPTIGGDANEVVVHKFKAASAAGARTSETLIPLSSIKSLAMATLFGKAYGAKWSSFDFKPFRELMQDRRAQAYAFPDLQNFSKEAHFILQSAAFSAPVIKNVRVTSEPGVLTADISMPATVQLLAPRVELKKHVPYVQFQGNVRGTVFFRVMDGKLAIQVKNASVVMKSAWNRAYVQAYKPNQKIADDLISQKLAEGLMGEAQYLKLPYWQWQHNQRLVPVALGLENEQVKLFWEITANPAGLAAR